MHTSKIRSFLQLFSIYIIIVTNELIYTYMSHVTIFDIYTPTNPKTRTKREPANRKEKKKERKGLKIDSGHNGGTVYYSFEGSMNKRLDSIVDIGVTLYVTEADVTTCRPED